MSLNCPDFPRLFSSFLFFSFQFCFFILKNVFTNKKRKQCLIDFHSCNKTNWASVLTIWIVFLLVPFFLVNKFTYFFSPKIKLTLSDTKLNAKYDFCAISLKTSYFSSEFFAKNIQIVLDYFINIFFFLTLFTTET